MYALNTLRGYENAPEKQVGGGSTASQLARHAAGVGEGRDGKDTKINETDRHVYRRPGPEFCRLGLLRGGAEGAHFAARERGSPAARRTVCPATYYYGLRPLDSAPSAAQLQLGRSRAHRYSAP